MEPGEVERTPGDPQYVSTYIPRVSKESSQVSDAELRASNVSPMQQRTPFPPEVLQQALYNPAALQQMSYNHGVLQHPLYNPALLQQALQANPELAQQFGYNLEVNPHPINSEMRQPEAYSENGQTFPPVTGQNRQNYDVSRHSSISPVEQHTNHTSNSFNHSASHQESMGENSQKHSHEVGEQYPNNETSRHSSISPVDQQTVLDSHSCINSNTGQQLSHGDNSQNFGNMGGENSLNEEISRHSSNRPAKTKQSIDNASVAQHIYNPAAYYQGYQQASPEETHQQNYNMPTQQTQPANDVTSDQKPPCIAETRISSSFTPDGSQIETNNVGETNHSHVANTEQDSSSVPKHSMPDTYCAEPTHTVVETYQSLSNDTARMQENESSNDTIEHMPHNNTIIDDNQHQEHIAIEDTEKETGFSHVNTHETSSQGIVSDDIKNDTGNPTNSTPAKSDTAAELSPNEDEVPVESTMKREISQSRDVPCEDQEATSCLSQLEVTVEAARFWVRRAESAGRRAAQHDPALQQSFQAALHASLQRFLLDVKAAAQQCVDQAAEYLPGATDQQADWEQALAAEAALDKDSSRHQRDVKPDPKQLLNPVRKRGRPRGRPRKSSINTRKRRPVRYSLPSDASEDDAEVAMETDEDRGTRVDSRVRVKVEPKTKSTPKRRKTREKSELVIESPVKDVDFAAIIPKCTECKMPFSTQADLVAHIQADHTDAPTIIKCKYCPKVFITDKAYKKHTMDVHRKNKKCPDCDKTFAYQYELENHQRVHQGAKQFQCKLCDFSAYKRSKINAHMKAKHGGAADGVREVVAGGEEMVGKEEGTGGRRARKLESGTESEEWYDTLEDAEHLCLICNIHFAGSDELTAHIQTHIGDHDDEDANEKQGEEKAEASKQGEQEPGSEQEAGSERKSAGPRRRVHEKRFRCPHCAETFPGKSLLDTHVALHKGEKPYSCDVCESAFKSLRALNLHTSVKHPARSRERPFHCWRCDKAFTFRAKYTAHMERVHKVVEDDDEEDVGEEPPGEHTCQKCRRTFLYARLLHRHVKRVHNKNLQCSTCQRRFAYPHELADHERLHTSDKALPCDFCQKPYRTRALVLAHAKVQHSEEVAELRYSCRVCSARFPISASLAHHEKSHRALNSSIATTLACDHCYMLFPSRLKLDKHVQNEHPSIEKIKTPAKTEPEKQPKTEADAGDEEEKSKEEVMEALPPQSKITPSHVCSQCGQEFASYKALAVHRKDAHPKAPDPRFTCGECGKMCEHKEALRNHRRRVHGKHRECSQCGKKFAFQYVLDRHLLTHTGERNFTCQVCQKTFYTLKELNVHVKISHVERAFKCEQCGAKFGTKQGLARHVTHLHTNYRPKRCEFCGKGFVDNRELKAHIFTHTRQSDIKCEKCGKMFGTRSCLNKHIRFVHDGEKKLCPICGKHIVSHLGMHMKSHGEKRFKCHLCPKIYAWPSALKEHMRTHTGEKPYQCQVCSKSFIGSANFVKHKKIHVKNALLGKAPKLHQPKPEPAPPPAAAEGDQLPQQQQQQQLANPSFEAYRAAMGALEASFHANAQLGANTYAAGHSTLSPGQNVVFDPSLVQL